MSMDAENDSPFEHSRPQRDRAYQQLRQILILRQAPEGQRLNEEPWSRQLGVNRAALREAFARLEAEGLIVKGIQPGYFVPALAQEDLSEIIEDRIILESGAIERICRLGLNTRENLTELCQARDRLKELAGRGEYFEVAQADRVFHEKLIAAARNQRLVTLYQRAPLPMIGPDSVRGEEWMERVEQTLQEHQTIIECLLQGDIGRAHATMRIHLHERLFIPVPIA